LRHLLGTLSPEALIICDAAYMGFELVRAILVSKRSFLFRMSSRVHLYTLEQALLKDWTEGPVLYWPGSAQDQGLAPIRCRLIRIPAKGKGKGSVKRDVWLLTDVLDPARLSVATAAKFYRWRWRNEISRPHYDRNDTLYQPGRSAYRGGGGATEIGTVVSQAA
jgi:hypothetical protein